MIFHLKKPKNRQIMTRPKARQTISPDATDQIEFRKQMKCHKGKLENEVDAVFFTTVPESIRKIVEKKIKNGGMNGQPVNILAEARKTSEALYQALREKVQETLPIQNHFAVYALKHDESTKDKAVFSVYATLI